MRIQTTSSESSFAVGVGIGFATAAVIGATTLVLWKKRPNCTNHTNDCTHSDNSNNNSSNSNEAPVYVLAKTDYVGAHLNALGSYFDPDSASDGHITLSIAENRIATSLLLPKLSEPGMSASSHHTYSTLSYTNPKGRPELLTAMAKFCNNYVLEQAVESCASTTTAVCEEDLFFTTGCTGAIELLFGALWTLRNLKEEKKENTKNDNQLVVLAPTPYFGGFDVILPGRVKLVACPVPIYSATDSHSVVPALERARLELLANSEARVDAILFSSPHNPTGMLWTTESVNAVVTWGQQHNIHTVIDTIYSSCVFKQQDARMSPSGIFNGGNNVHVVSAISKDFGVCGLRVGYVHTRNERVQALLQRMCHKSEVPGPTQSMVAAVLSDKPFIDKFLVDLSTQLESQYRAVVERLSVVGIPCLAAKSGVFVMVDLRRFLGAMGKSLTSWEAEVALWQYLLEHAKVGLTPGCRMHVYEAGWFRWCFAYHVDARVNVEAAARLISALKQLEAR